MLSIKLICVGKMKEPHYIAAVSEYEKRLAPFCKFDICELPEAKLPQNPSSSEIEAGLSKESIEIRKQIPAGAFVIAMCIEGRLLSSTEFSNLLQSCAGKGYSKICCVIGSSNGLSEAIKDSADFKLSMSKMTFPHHLARVMLTEQVYRGIMIAEGSKYHK